MDPLAAFSTLLMHGGSRHMNFDLTEAQKKLLNNITMRYVILFGMFYISTRSLKWSVILLIFYILLLNVFLNEKHPLHLYSPKWLEKEGLMENSNSNNLISSTNYYHNIQKNF